MSGRILTDCTDDLGATTLRPTPEISDTSIDLKQYRLFDDTLLVMCESAQLTAQIHEYLKPLIIPPEAWRKVTVRLAAFRAPQDNVLLCCPEAGFLCQLPERTRAYIGFRQLMRTLTFDPQYAHYPMHACCVVGRFNQAVLLAGPPSAGKTTLTAALLQRGFRFAGDDQAYLLQDGSVLSYPVGSSVSVHAFALIPELAPLKSPLCRFRVPQGWEWVVNFGDAFPFVSPYEKLQVTNVFFLTPNFGGVSNIAECDAETATWRFLSSSHARKRSAHSIKKTDCNSFDSGLQLIQTLRRKVRFYEVLNGNLHSTADLIAKTIGE